MQTEFEATFMIDSKEQIRNILKNCDAKLIKKEFLQRRVVFNLPRGHEIEHGWLRVRDEKDKITLSLKVVHNNTGIENQKELQLNIDNFDSAVELLLLIGCEKKSYQENLRELWIIDSVEITIDEWPFMEPYIEIEGPTEDIVKKVTSKLGFDYSKAYFGSIDGMYAKKYSITEDRVNNHTPQIIFKMENPFMS